MGKLVKTSLEYCRECKYATITGGGYKLCDYYLVTGKHRDCDVGVCDKFEEKDEETRRNRVKISII